MKKQIKEYWEMIKSNILFLLGVSLFLYNLFNFTSGRSGGYWYSNGALTGLAIGGILITIGIIKLRRNK